MTCIVAYIDRKNKKQYIASDSCVSFGMNYALKHNETKKIHSMADFFVGTAGVVGTIQLIFNSFIIPDREESMTFYDYLQDMFCNQLRIHLLQYGLCEEERIWEMLIVHEGDIYKIGGDYSVIKLANDFWSIGMGEVALGYLEALKKSDVSITDKIKGALKASCDYCAGVKPPFHIKSADYGKIQTKSKKKP